MKKLLALVLTCSMLLAMGGCGGAAASSSAAPAPAASAAPAPAAPAAPAEPVTLEVWYALSGASGESFLAVIEDFNKLNTGVTINASYSGGYGDTATKITAALQSKTTPDILIGGQPAYTGAFGNFYAGEQVVADKEFDYADVFPGLWDYAMYNGKICNIPYGISTPLMYYNKSVVEAAGVDLEKSAPATWAEFVTVCKTVQAHYAGNKDFAAFVVKDMPWLFKSQLGQVGNKVIATNADFSQKTAAFGSPECAEVAQWWQTMVKEGVTTVGDNANAENVFLAGNAAFFAGSSTKISDWAATLGDNMRAIPMPYFTKKAVALGGNTISIFPSQKEAQTQAAWSFVKFITNTAENAKFALGSGYMPIRASALKLPEMEKAFAETPAYKTAFTQLDCAFSYVNIDNYAALDNSIKGAIAKVVGDLNYDCAKAMTEAAAEYDAESKN